MIAIGVVLVWRGVWEITDIYLLPGYKTASAIASIIIGVLILYLPDGTLEHLSGYKEDEEVKKSY